MTNGRDRLQTLRRARRRQAVALCSALVMAAIAVAAVFVVTSGPSVDELAALDDVDDLPLEIVVDAGDEDGAGTGQATALQAPVVTYEIFLARDPFQPVIPEDVVAPVADASDDPTGADPQPGTGPDTGAPTGTVGTGTGTGVAPGTSTGERVCPSGPEVVCEGRVLTVTDIRRGDDGEFVAVIQVDTTIYEVRRRDEFSSNPVFAVLNITASTVTLQTGDSAFTLNTGDSVLK